MSYVRINTLTMSNLLVETIVSKDDFHRNRSINSLLKNRNNAELLKLVAELEGFRKVSKNLYHKVRASFFLFAIYRFYLQTDRETTRHGRIPFDGVKAAFDRDFEKSINIFLKEIEEGRRNSALFSAIAESYYKLSFKYLLDQVKLSISQCSENFHLFNIKSLDDYPFSVLPELTTPEPETGFYPFGFDTSPVRLDPSHSGWSDIFFLGMDFPEGARVVNLSVNLKIHGSADPILPPCECYCRFIQEPVIHLISIDLKSSKKITTLTELFNFGNDYLSLLKAGVVASGIVPPCFEGKNIPLKEILFKLLGKQGGIEVITRVNGIPKGSRLAVSTTLLSTVITRLMRFSGQIKNQTGSLTEEERRTVASRAILGEWLGGSGGGWQDSGGLWPGIKVITGKLSEKGEPEFGLSRGCLLPRHNLFSRDEIPGKIEEKILNSMVLVHGGISQDVGPILEMVTEKYLLRHEKEWEARKKGICLFDEIVDALKTGDMKRLGSLTTRDWEESIQQIIPWVNNAFTDDLINKAKDEFGDNYWGFLMLGGMSGGGMAFIVNPEIKDKFKNRIAVIMRELKQTYAYSFPFITESVVYDFEFNHEGITAQLLTGSNARIPALCQDSIHKTPSAEFANEKTNEEDVKRKYGFDSKSHEYTRTMLKKGEIGLARNRLSQEDEIHDVNYDEILHFEEEIAGEEFYRTGMDAIKRNEIAVITFAGGMGSRWTHGAAVVKPINPFIKINGKYRTFLEIHLAKSRKTAESCGKPVQHVFTTSYLTHDAIVNYLKRFNFCCKAIDSDDYEGDIYLSCAQTIGHRVYPMERDLRFLLKEQLQQKPDENIRKIQEAQHLALIEWVKSRGEGDDYAENNPALRFNPPGHWYEIPNLIKNGTLAKMLRDNPSLKYLLCHNIDTMGAYIEPFLLGMHIFEQACLTFEVTPRRVEDRGGGLAKVNGHIRLVEGLALPKEEDEYRLSYYNTLTNWITIDSLLEFFGLDRGSILEADKHAGKKDEVTEAIHRIEKRIPTYVTIKNVQYLWGTGQEDIHPVAQFEKLWGDMTAFRDLKVSYIGVSRYCGQQLKEPSQLDRWLIDGSFEYVKSKAIFK